MRHPLDCFVNPTSVAVIGASTVPHKTGGRRWRSMVEAGFPGPLYPIHPSAPEVLGRKAYRSLREVPDAVDLAVVLVRPDLVPGVIAECAELRVPGVADREQVAQPPPPNFSISTGIRLFCIRKTRTRMNCKYSPTFTFWQDGNSGALLA